MTALRETDREPGRELDAMVAERLMGFLWHKWCPTMDRDAAPDLRGHRFLKPGDTLEKFREGGWKDGPWVLADGTEPTYTGEGKDREVPNYSTDITAAWLVVEKMREGQSYVLIEHRADDGWIAQFGFNDTASAETAPLAICRAALSSCSPSDETDNGN